MAHHRKVDALQSVFLDQGGDALKVRPLIGGECGLFPGRCFGQLNCPSHYSKNVINKASGFGQKSKGAIPAPANPLKSGFHRLRSYAWLMPAWLTAVGRAQNRPESVKNWSKKADFLVAKTGLNISADLILSIRIFRALLFRPQYQCANPPPARARPIWVQAQRKFLRLFRRRKLSKWALSPQKTGKYESCPLQEAPKGRPAAISRSSR
jgi:hypothetical protein